MPILPNRSDASVANASRRRQTMLAVALLASGAAHAVTVDVSQFDVTDLSGPFTDLFNDKTDGYVVEDFESTSTLSVGSGGLTGTLTDTLTSSLVGTFTTIGGIGSGSTCAANNAAAGISGNSCEQIARTEGELNGQGNLVPPPVEGEWSLNSNDTYGLVWEASLSGPVTTFTDLVFGIQDPADQRATVTVEVDGTVVSSAEIAPRQPDAEIFLIHLAFSEAVDSATIRLESSMLNDAFSFDGAAILATPVPAAVWLFGSVLAGARGAQVLGRRRRKTGEA